MMTGRELILYILENGLENEPVFKNGTFVGFMTVTQAAEKLDVGLATIFAWNTMGKLDGMLLRGGIYIPVTAKSPTENEGS
jgi:hypothetical protein